MATFSMELSHYARSRPDWPGISINAREAGGKEVNPKSKLENRTSTMTKSKCAKRIVRWRVSALSLYLGHLDLFRVSNFVLRALRPCPLRLHLL
jgi:hypothetical protein